MLSEISQKQILYDIINHMWNLKKTQQTSEHNERHRLTDTKNKPGSAVEGGAQRRGSTGLGGEGTKLLGKDGLQGMYCTTQGLQSVFYNNWKRKITFKHYIQ